MKRSGPMKRTGRLRARSRTNSKNHADPALVREYRESNRACEFCGGTDGCEVNHIWTNPRLDVRSNVITLCNSHHYRFFHRDLIHGRIVCLAYKWAKDELDWGEVQRAMGNLRLAGWLVRDDVVLHVQDDVAVEALRRVLLKLVEGE